MYYIINKSGLISVDGNGEDFALNFTVTSVRCTGGVCVFLLLAGLLCICTLCILALLDLAIQPVGPILVLLTWYRARVSILTLCC